MVKMVFTDNQVAFEYAVYMIIGSYFKKTTCSNKLQEQKMRIQYHEQKLENQYRMEEICIHFWEDILSKEFPETFWESEAKVKFLPVPGSIEKEIAFIVNDSVLRIKGQYKGRKTRLYIQAA